MTILLLTALAAAPLALTAPAAVALAAAAPVKLAPATSLEDERGAEELVDELKDHIREDGDEDAEAIAVIDEMLQRWEGFDEKERKKVVKALGRCFKEDRDPLAEGVPNDGLFRAAAAALGEMGGERAAKELDDWIDHKSHRDNIGLQRELILSLGRTKAEDAVEPLIDLLMHREFVLQGAAAEALGEFEDAEEDVRKEIFERIVKLIAPLHARILVDSGADVILRQQYDAVAGPMITTLRRVSGHDERDPQEFMRWWNKNKKEDWTRES